MLPHSLLLGRAGVLLPLCSLLRDLRPRIDLLLHLFSLDASLEFPWALPLAHDLLIFGPEILLANKLFKIGDNGFYVT